MGLRKDSRSHAPAWECGADAPASLQYTEKADHSQKTGLILTVFVDSNFK